MRKAFIGFIALVLMIYSVATAEHLTSLSDKELIQLMESIQTELANRGTPTTENGSILINELGILVTIEDKPFFSDGWGVPWINIPVIIENNAKHKIELVVEKPSVNGWMLNRAYFHGVTPLPGKKARGELCFNVTEAGIRSADEFSYAEFTIVMKDENYKEIKRLQPQILYSEPKDAR